MLRVLFCLVAVLFCSQTTSGQNNNLAYHFSSPVKPVSNYEDEGPFLSIYNGKYHVGSDFNIIGDPRDDYDKTFFAVANGVVDEVRIIPGRHSWGTRVQIKHTTLDNRVYYSRSAHLKSVSSKIVEGAKVFEGQLIGTIGDAGGYYSPHLHFEIATDPNLDAYPQAYATSPLKPGDIKNYRNPSLFIDDRGGGGQQSVPLTRGVWKTFKPLDSSSMLNAYVIYNGNYYTFASASSTANKLIDASAKYRWQGDTLWKSLTQAEVFWWGDVQYQVKALKAGVTLYLVIPGYGFQKERAVTDMLWFVSKNSRFTSCDPESVSSISFGDEQDDWLDLRTMQCSYRQSNGQVVTAIIYHATNIAHPLFRYINYDLGGGEYSYYYWPEITPNQMDP